MKSFIYFTNTSLCKSFWKILFIIFWNVPSKLHNPKYITLVLNSSLFVKNTIFYSSSSLIHMLLYSQIKSNLLKYLVSLSLSITFLMKSSGVFFFIICWFNFL